MLLDLEDYADTKYRAANLVVVPMVRPDWSIIVPFFNERDFLSDTLTSLAAQNVPAKIILIDNGSTDGSAEIARAACRRLGADFLLITERTPGKVAALAAGLRVVRTPFVATCDADTWYPHDYLSQAARVLSVKGRVVAGAFFIPERTDDVRREKAGRKICATARVLRGQCHTGGAGQAFRTDILRRAGGFDPARWSYVLEDHEIIHRVMKFGSMGYSEGLWCSPSERERDRDSIRWTLAERLLYAVSAPVAGDWFFYRFLSSRLRARKLTSERIRERPFQELERANVAASYSMCG